MSPDAAGVLGILHDVEFARIPPDYSAKVAVAVRTDGIDIPSKEYGYPGSPKSASAMTQTHTKFASTTQRGAAMSVRP